MLCFRRAWPRLFASFPYLRVLPFVCSFLCGPRAMPSCLVLYPSRPWSRTPGHAWIFVASPQVYADENAVSAAFGKGEQVQARVLFVDMQRKVVSLTMKPSLVAWDLQPCGSIPAGDIVEEATVVRLDSTMGVLLRLTAEDEEDA